MICCFRYKVGNSLYWVSLISHFSSGCLANCIFGCLVLFFLKYIVWVVYGVGYLFVSSESVSLLFFVLYIGFFCMYGGLVRMDVRGGDII